MAIQFARLCFFFLVNNVDILLPLLDDNSLPAVSSGVISGLTVVGKNVAAGLIMIFVGIFFGVLAVISFAILIKVQNWDTCCGPSHCMSAIFCFISIYLVVALGIFFFLPAVICWCLDLACTYMLPHWTISVLCNLGSYFALVVLALSFFIFCQFVVNFTVIYYKWVLVLPELTIILNLQWVLLTRYNILLLSSEVCYEYVCLFFIKDIYW